MSEKPDVTYGEFYAKRSIPRDFHPSTRQWPNRIHGLPLPRRPTVGGRWLFHETGRPCRRPPIKTVSPLLPLESRPRCFVSPAVRDCPIPRSTLLLEEQRAADFRSRNPCRFGPTETAKTIHDLDRAYRESPCVGQLNTSTWNPEHQLSRRDGTDRQQPLM